MAYNILTCDDVLNAYKECSAIVSANCAVQVDEYYKYWGLAVDCLNKENDRKYLKLAVKLLLTEFCVPVTAFLVFILAVFGATRRRRDSKLVKVPVFLSYAFSSKLVYYSIGLMQAISSYDKSVTFWAAFLLIALAKADSMTAFSVDDNEAKRSFLLDAVLQFLLGSYLVINSFLGDTEYYNENPIFRWVLCVLFIWGLLKAFGTAKAMKSASMSSGLARSSKLVFEYMKDEHKREYELSEYNMESLNQQTIISRYNYLVAGGEDEVTIRDDKVITLQKVWKYGGWLITSSKYGSRCKDLCLSYSLFRLMCCRYGGYSFPISTQEKSWNLVRHGLISDSEEESSRDHERVFRVIEVELGFLYDFLYTKYPYITGKGYLVFRLLEIVIVGIGCWAAVVTLTPALKKEDGYLLDTDIIVTVIVIASMVLVQLVELFYVITSDWLKVKLICRYVQKKSWWIEKKMIMAICSVQWKPWSRKMKQYSLLESFGYTPSLIVYNRCVTLVIDKPRKGQQESKEIGLPEGVKKAIVASLKLNGPKLSNGLASLRRNGFGDQLGWACKLKTTTHVILVWHIATRLCEIQLSGTRTECFAAASLRNNEHFFVANSLSKYCSYLVAFQPKLLPDHPCITESIFDGLVKETRESLKRCKTKFDKHGKMMELGRQEHQNSIIKMGAQLGLRLVQGISNDDVRWKVLADFWAELVLFLAPSEELKSHAKQLASGGEFLTHLMALLFHAGIIDRDSAVHHDI